MGRSHRVEVVFPASGSPGRSMDRWFACFLIFCAIVLASYGVSLYTNPMPNASIIPFQPPLPQVLPTIEGNVDYRDLRDQLLRIEKLLCLSGLETQFLQTDLDRWLDQRKKVSAKVQQNHQRHSQRALRCKVARLLLKENYRDFAARLADSPLLQ